MAKVLLPWHLHRGLTCHREGNLWKNGIFSHYCYKRDDLCQILKFCPKPMRDVGRENAVHRAPVVFPQNAKKGTRPIYQATNETEERGKMATDVYPGQE
jgi:hypothetical protein